MPSRRSDTPLSVSVLRIVPCGACGGRRRTLVDTSEGLRGHCMGCGAEVGFPFATERTQLVPAGRRRLGRTALTALA